MNAVDPSDGVVMELRRIPREAGVRGVIVAVEWITFLLGLLMGAYARERVYAELSWLRSFNSAVQFLRQGIGEASSFSALSLKLFLNNALSLSLLVVGGFMLCIPSCCLLFMTGYCLGSVAFDPGVMARLSFTPCLAQLAVVYIALELSAIALGSYASATLLQAVFSNGGEPRELLERAASLCLVALVLLVPASVIEAWISVALMRGGA